ncbi:hypothetical protein SLE2022_173740 [Rubroshorea leprosula]
MDLSNNNRSGSIPSCIHNLTAIIEKESLGSKHGLLIIDENFFHARSYVDKESVMWKGMECDYGDGNLKNLRIINLSSNKLIGEIPINILSLSRLHQLNLSRNHLTGKILSYIGQIRQIPLSTQMQTFDASAFVGNPEPCGLPLKPTYLEHEKSKSKPTDYGGNDNKEDRVEF